MVWQTAIVVMALSSLLFVFRAVAYHLAVGRSVLPSLCLGVVYGGALGAAGTLTLGMLYLAFG
ncbi:hypothetical protein [Salinicola aestuarinus]|uniref:hypothetical protein n=1 Tax=Salinicola aestuarinus TaxID=1949082 RepID=UPI000DA206C9|nr:hypothetical protein [Salinicola aestuarinus]